MNPKNRLPRSPLTPEATALALLLATIGIKSIAEEPSYADAPSLVRLMFAMTAPCITALSGAGCGVLNAFFGYRRRHRTTAAENRPDFLSITLKQAAWGGIIGLAFGIGLALAKPMLTKIPALTPQHQLTHDCWNILIQAADEALNSAAQPVPKPADKNALIQGLRPDSLLPRGS
jgi:hypothetical protein